MGPRGLTFAVGVINGINGMKETTFRVVTADDVDPADLDRFLQRAFSKQQCDFWRDHSLWVYRGNQHRLVALNHLSQIVGQYAYIPTVIWLLDRKMSASFWVDLYVDPQWRKRGIQRQLDQISRQTTDLQLSFPNELSTAIHRKHGLAIRDDFRIMMAPFHPTKLPRLLINTGRRGQILRYLATLTKPAAWLYRRRLEQYQATSARILEQPEAEFLANIFLKYRNGMITTNRTPDFIQWRYLESPHRSEYSFLLGGAEATPSLAAVCHTTVSYGVLVTRLIDLFGDLEDHHGVADLLKLVVGEAARRGSSQVTALASTPGLRAIMRANGFVLSRRFPFRWSSQDPETMRIIGKRSCHWVLADSDNDLILT